MNVAAGIRRRQKTRSIAPFRDSFKRTATDGDSDGRDVAEGDEDGMGGLGQCADLAF